MKTFRRDKLLRLAQAGKLIAVGSYHFDDMHGSSSLKSEMPVYVVTGGSPRIEGSCGVYPSDFNSNSGRAWQNDNGTITLIVHSNCNYTFKIKE